MGFQSKIMISVLGTIMLLALMMVKVNGGCHVPCYFVFGDSVVDPGNNNGLATTAKVNYLPYGIDFPDGPTGRFSNGLNFADVITQLLGFGNFTPPFTNTTGNDILLGVNYGSGGAGIRDETGKELGERFSMNEQLKNHELTVSRIATIKKSSQAAKNYLSKCIYTVGMGSNDYINNYLQPEFYYSSRIFTPDMFANLLIKQYSLQLAKLYSYGARKVAIFGLGFIGCTPAEIAINGADPSGCVDKINNYTTLFNNRIQPLVNSFNQFFPGAKFTYIDIAKISAGVSGGGLITNVPCCNTNNLGLCDPGSVPCSDRNDNAFFDGFHPCQLVNLVFGTISYNASSNPTAANPSDLSTLSCL